MTTSTRSLLRHTLALGASLLFAATTLVAADQTYPVNFSSPWEIGQRYTTSSTASQTNHMLISQGPNILQEQTQKHSAKLEADVEALGTFPHGGLSKAAYTIRSLLVSVSDGVELEFLPPGTVVVVESLGADKKTYTIDGKPASDEQVATLKLVLSTDAPDHNDQMIFGPKQPVAVGESWEPDLKVMLSTLGKDFGGAATINGKMKLDAVDGEGAKQISTVSGTINIGNVLPPLPPGVTPKSGKLTIKLTGRIPATRTASTRFETLDMNVAFGGEATPPGGAPVTLAMTMETKSAHTDIYP